MIDKKKRLEAIKAMHTLVCMLNDESAYMCWINLVPDEATEQDLVDMSKDDGDMEDVSRKFIGIMSRFGNDGFYLGEDRTGKYVAFGAKK